MFKVRIPTKDHLAGEKGLCNTFKYQMTNCPVNAHMRSEIYTNNIV